MDSSTVALRVALSACARAANAAVEAIRSRSLSRSFPTAFACSVARSNVLRGARGSGLKVSGSSSGRKLSARTNYRALGAERSPRRARIPERNRPEPRTRTEEAIACQDASSS